MIRQPCMAVTVTGLLVMLGTHACLGNSASAQITPDATLGLQRSVVTPNMMIQGIPSDRIDSGAIRGANLFHSFQEFNIGAGRGAYFTNPAGIENILTRVTGSNPSNILGRLGVLGNANLFLLNPNGIIFGSNASLDLGGSFLGTTASSILFTDGTKFSALTTPQSTPLLTVSVPVGLGFNTTPGRIVNQSRASEPGNSQPVGLAVQTGKTLALVGGDVTMDGGIIRAPGGRIELGSVQQQGQVDITPTPLGWALGYAGVNNFGDIQLSGGALVDTSGIRGGEIQIQGRELSLNSGSSIVSITTGAQAGGTIAINTTDSVELTGTGNYGQTNTKIITNIIRPDEAGNVIISEGLGSGAAGDIAIKTGKFIQSNNTYVGIYTLGSGRGGNLSLNAESVSVSASSLFSGTLFGSTGNAGDLTIDTRSLLVRDNSSVSTASLGAGNGGNLTVNASESVELIGTNRITLPGGLGSLGTNLTTLILGAGNAGDLRVTTGRLTLRDGATIDANSNGGGGNVTITARDSVSLIGESSDRIGSAVSARGNLGVGGDITISTGNLIIQDGAEITASSFANAGNVTVVARDIRLDNRASLAVISPAGEGGNVHISTQSLQLFNNSELTATAGFAGGAGNGGNITINTETLVALGNSNISANAFQGRGGNIQITTQGIFQSADSDITASSQTGINGVVSVRTFGLDFKNSLTPIRNNLISTEKAIAGSCLARRNIEQGKFVYTGTGGLEITPYDAFSAEYTVIEVMPIQGSTTDAKIGSDTTAPWKLGDPIVEAQAIVRTPDGRILLTALPQPDVAPADDIVCHSN